MKQRTNKSKSDRSIAKTALPACEPLISQAPIAALSDHTRYNFADALDEWTKRLNLSKVPSAMNADCYLLSKDLFDGFLIFAHGLTAAARELDALDNPDKLIAVIESQGQSPACPTSR